MINTRITYTREYDNVPVEGVLVERFNHINEGYIEFKTANKTTRNGTFVRHAYTKNEIDYFVTSFEEKCYLIPVEECGCDKRLRLLPTKNGQTRGISWAKDYEMEEVIKNW